MEKSKDFVRGYNAGHIEANANAVRCLVEKMNFSVLKAAELLNLSDEEIQLIINMYE